MTVLSNNLDIMPMYEYERRADVWAMGIGDIWNLNMSGGIANMWQYVI